MKNRPLMSMFHTSSKANNFYKFLLKQHLNGTVRGTNNLVGRVHDICDKYDVSFVRYLCDDKYARTQSRSIKRFLTNDGVVDTVRHLLSDLNSYNTSLIHMLLKSF